MECLIVSVMKRFLCILFSIVFVLLGCKKEPKAVEVTAVTISQPTSEMIIGETTQLQVSIVPTNATDKTVTWTSSNKSVATVSESGLVTAISEGVTSITAAAGGISAFCHITVIKGFVEVSSIRLNTSSLYLVEDEQATLSATVFPEDATDKSVIWRSSDTSVASVESGIVSALKSGTATISAESGKQSAQCIVIVKSNVIPVSEIILNANKLVLMEGQEDELVATVKPDNATDKTVIWTSSDESVAEVDSNGRVYAIKGGATIITATSGEKQAVCLVEVQKRIPVSSVTLNKESLTLEKGASETLVAEVSPYDATDKTVIWTSSNPSIASVSNGVVKAIAGGNVTITAKAGGLSATCDVTVIVSVTSIVLSKSSISLNIGDSETIVAKIKPEDATNKNVSWSSNDQAVAIIDDSGTLIAKGQGTTSIIATAETITASCVVTVFPPLTEAGQKAEAVDLGLSVKWASFNVGASKPEEYGDYFAWGETKPKDYGVRYTWYSYQYANGANYKLTKYCPKNKEDYWDGKGEPDDIRVLEPEDDAAHVNWGGGWRMPTSTEWRELINSCKFTWTPNYNELGIAGYIVSRNDKSIFLPAAGGKAGDTNGAYGVGESVYYQSSTLYLSDPSQSYSFGSHNGMNRGVFYYHRFHGFPVRAICP